MICQLQHRRVYHSYQSLTISSLLPLNPTICQLKSRRVYFVSESLVVCPSCLSTNYMVSCHFFIYITFLQDVYANIVQFYGVLTSYHKRSRFGGQLKWHWVERSDLAIHCGTIRKRPLRLPNIPAPSQCQTWTDIETYRQTDKLTGR